MKYLKRFKSVAVKIFQRIKLYFALKKNLLIKKSQIVETKKFMLMTFVTLCYIAFAYIYEFNAIRRESEFLVNSFSKQIDFSISKVADYIKVNVSYYNNIFSLEEDKEHYITNNLYWNTNNFYTLDNFNRYNIYDYGNLTGFGTPDGILDLKEEMSLILNANEIYKDIYINHSDYIERVLYSSKNNFAYSYPYQLSKYYSYADRLVVEKDFDKSINLNDINWSKVFIDQEKEKFGMSLYKDIYDIENGIQSTIGTLAVDITLPEYKVLPQYEYYVLDSNLDILGTNNTEVLVADGVKSIYEVKNSFEKSSLTENIINEEQLFSFNGEIFSSKKIKSAPLYFVISKQKFYVLNHLYYVITASFTSILIGAVSFNEYHYHRRASKYRKKKIQSLRTMKNKLLAEQNKYELTGLYKKEFMLKKLEELWKEKASTVVTIIEIDRHENLNEIYGRIVLEKITKDVANIIEDVVGTRGYLGHLNNSSYIYIMEETDFKKASSIAQIIKKRVAEEYFSIYEEICIRLTISAGVAEQRYDESDYLATIDNASSAVLEAKQKGYNRVVLYKHKMK